MLLWLLIVPLMWKRTSSENQMWLIHSRVRSCFGESHSHMTRHLCISSAVVVAVDGVKV